MIARRQIVLALTSIFFGMGATYPTPNFIVHAPTPQIAQQVGQWAEHYRKEKALQWLGREMPNWPEQCPLHVQVSMNGPSGATSFNFGRDRSGNGVVMGQRMEIQGPLDRLLASVLPHEITHTVFAYHFKQPVPRWADEGGSVLSEDNVERERHNQLVRNILNSGQQIRMRTLFGLKEYPSNVMALYAQGYSIADYLVKRSDRHTFLNFVAHGLMQGWDSAVWSFYRHRSVEELEEAWLQHLRETRGQPHIEVAQAKPSQEPGQSPENRQLQGTVVRLTVPPAPQEARPAAIIRGAMPSESDGNQTFGNRAAGNRPGYLPDVNTPGDPGWQPTTAAPSVPPRYDYERQQQQPFRPVGARTQTAANPVAVQLGPPQFSQGPPEAMPVSPGSMSPVGFPQ